LINVGQLGESIYDILNFLIPFLGSLGRQRRSGKWGLLEREMGFIIWGNFFLEGGEPFKL